MKCPHCAEEVKDEARICRFCNRSIIDEGEKVFGKQGARRIFNIILLVSMLVGLPIFFASFHIMLDVPTIVAKDNLTFADTFIDLTELINRWNRGTFIEKINMSQSGLYMRLVERKLIVLGDKDRGY